MLPPRWPIALEKPMNRTIDLAGPEPIRLDELVRQYLQAQGDSRRVVTDESAGYFGTPVDDRSLTSGENPRLGCTRFADWLGRTALVH